MLTATPAGISQEPYFIEVYRWTRGSRCTEPNDKRKATVNHDISTDIVELNLWQVMRKLTLSNDS